jgi:hypothetical protein
MFARFCCSIEQKLFNKPLAKFQIVLRGVWAKDKYTPLIDEAKEAERLAEMAAALARSKKLGGGDVDEDDEDDGDDDDDDDE